MKTDVVIFITFHHILLYVAFFKLTLQDLRPYILLRKQ